MECMTFGPSLPIGEGKFSRREFRDWGVGYEGRVPSPAQCRSELVSLSS